jgi:hypothetical protein
MSAAVIVAPIFLLTAPVSKETTPAASPEQLTKLAEEFLSNLRENKIDALIRSVGTPWYNGGTIVEKEDDLRAVLGAMAEWYDEDRAAAYRVLASNTYKTFKTDEERTDLGEADIKKLDSFLAADDWLVVVGKEKKPKLYILVKSRKGKLSVVGAHK